MSRRLAIGIILLIGISGCRLNGDGDDADRISTLDRQANEDQINGKDIGAGKIVPEIGGGLMMLLGLGTLWATRNGWRA